MTQGPETPEPQQPAEGGASVPPPSYGEPTPPPPPPSSGEATPPPPPPYGEPTPPPYQQPLPPQGGYEQPQGAYQQQPAPGGYAPYGAGPAAPYGVNPTTGVPYSDKSKLVAGLLQIFLGGLGIGRFYIGDTKTGIWQIVVTVLTCGIGSLWGLIDGIIMLATDNVTDRDGRPLRPN